MRERTMGDEVLEKIEEAGRVKKYELMKDLPGAKSGTIFYGTNDGLFFPSETEVGICGTHLKFYEAYIKCMPDWFREVSGRWRPKVGESYFWVSSDLFISCKEFLDFPVDRSRFDGGNFFRTREEAQEAAELVKKTLLEFHERKAR